MDSKLAFVAGLLAASYSQPASAQTFLSSECVAPQQAASMSHGLVTLQSQVVSTRTIPVAARLLSSRVVATGFAPATQLNSFSTFGTASVPLTTSFAGSSAPVVQPLTTFGLQSNVGFPTTFAAPSAFTLAPQAVTNSPLTFLPPAAVSVLATRIANENNLAAAARVQSNSASCCSSGTLESLSKRIETLDEKLSKLEKSLGQQGGDTDGLFPGESKADDDQPNSSGDPIDELLGGAVD